MCIRDRASSIVVPVKLGYSGCSQKKELLSRYTVILRQLGHHVGDLLSSKKDKGLEPLPFSVIIARPSSAPYSNNVLVVPHIIVLLTLTCSIVMSMMLIIR